MGCSVLPVHGRYVVVVVVVVVVVISNRSIISISPPTHTPSHSHLPLLHPGTHALFAFTTNVPPIALMCCIGVAYVTFLSHHKKV